MTVAALLEVLWPRHAALSLAASLVFLCVGLSFSAEAPSLLFPSAAQCTLNSPVILYGAYCFCLGHNLQHNVSSRKIFCLGQYANDA